MHLQPIKKIGWTIFFGHLLIVYEDVVVFYTTYKANAYDMPFDIFVGVNNNGKTILFSCSLLQNETTSLS